MPLDWAMSIGNQGVAKMILAEQKKKPRDGWDGLKQIEAALEVTRAGGACPECCFLRSASDRGARAPRTVESPLSLAALVSGVVTAYGLPRVSRSTIFKSITMPT
jgi:hypothetical protein